MSNTKEVIRIYFIADADAIEHSKTKLGLFEEDKAKFITLDADFTDPYGVDWLARAKLNS